MTGATGYVGSRLVTALLADGHEVVTATRNPQLLKRLGWFDDVTPVTLDASDPVSVRAGMRAAGPIDVVYYLVHAIGQPDFRDADKAAAANLAMAARDAGVRRIVYLGGFVPADEVPVRAPEQPGRGGRGPDGRERPGAGVARRGDDHRRRIDVVRDDALRGRPVPAHPDSELDGQPDRPDLHPRRPALSGRRGRPDRVPAGAYDISGPDTTSYRRAAQDVCAHLRHGGMPACRSAGSTRRWRR